MRVKFFWESTQRARRTHFCDWCFEYISPGQLYRRQYCSDFRGGLRNKLICEHVDPGCPLEHDIRVAAPPEREELGVPTVLMLENRLVQRVLINGEVVTEPEAYVVMREAPANLISVMSYGLDTTSREDEDVPF